ncbi:MAG: HAMP domain-containing sensor histidine kinase [Rhodospirillales bacterium]|jgi:signal transduction histidine kinase|nr:HAMP domain-containing sensor histidine kinase [Rhodospirillales bacterium]MDP6774975.1 HAMP domain-containing sensor histidine kinase [Rhodospirillales bacterium]
MSESSPYRPSLATSLSARLLVLTVAFVMLAELLIYTPSIARFRKAYLEEHIAKAQLAALAVEAAPEMTVDADLERRLLSQAGAYGIILREPDRKVLMLSGDMPPDVDVVIDLGKGSFLTWIRDAFLALAQDENRVMRVMGVSPSDEAVMIETLMDETPMRQAMYGYSQRILQLSIVISLITAGLVYLSLQLLMVRPMGRITQSMVSFRANPEDASASLPLSERQDEIGVAQRELAVMQNDLRLALRQKTRLATLGAAVAKINHDLRNSLATAVLVSDRLADIDDPEVKRVTPRLYNAIDRAINLCSQTLIYAQEPRTRLNPTHFYLHELVAEVSSAMREAETGDGELTWEIDVAGTLDLEADREQLYRLLINLAQNAREAGATRLRLSASGQGRHVHVEMADNGPGLPDKARENLFKPFAGSARDGGTGLGLVIADDIMRAHGGALSLVETSDKGTTFRFELPAGHGVLSS